MNLKKEDFSLRKALLEPEEGNFYIAKNMYAFVVDEKLLVYKNRSIQMNKDKRVLDNMFEGDKSFFPNLEIKFFETLYLSPRNR